MRQEGTLASGRQADLSGGEPVSPIPRLKGFRSESAPVVLIGSLRSAYASSQSGPAAREQSGGEFASADPATRATAAAVQIPGLSPALPHHLRSDLQHLLHPETPYQPPYPPPLPRRGRSRLGRGCRLRVRRAGKVTAQCVNVTALHNHPRWRLLCHQSKYGMEPLAPSDKTFSCATPPQSPGRHARECGEPDSRRDRIPGDHALGSAGQQQCNQRMSMAGPPPSRRVRADGLGHLYPAVAWPEQFHQIPLDPQEAIADLSRL